MAETAESEEIKRVRGRVIELETEREISRRAAGLLDERVERVQVFAFIDEQTTDFDNKTLCVVRGVARSW